MRIDWRKLGKALLVFVVPIFLTFLFCLFSAKYPVNKTTWDSAIQADFFLSIFFSSFVNMFTVPVVVYYSINWDKPLLPQ